MATTWPPGVPPFGAEVDDPVGGADDVEVVLDDDQRVAQVGQAVEDAQEVLDVGEVQAGGRLVEDVEGPAGGHAAQLGGELHALGLAAGEGRAGLAERDVAEAGVVQGLQASQDFRDRVEEGDGLIDPHFQHVADRAPLEAGLQRLAVEPLAPAGLAADVQIRQELHLDLAEPLALAGSRTARP